MVIANVPASVEFVIAQVDDHVKRTLILQFLKEISRVWQKLMKYFNGTAILASGTFPVTFTLDLNEAFLPGKLTILPLLSQAVSYL